MAVDPEPDSGPVLVAVRFTVTAERQAEFLAAMEQLRRSRLRTGAPRWELYRDAERRDGFVEMFRVSSWEEHLRQHDDRLTATDQGVEEAALACLRSAREQRPLDTAVTTERVGRRPIGVAT